MAYRIELSPAAQRDIKRFSSQVVPLIEAAVLSLENDAYPPGARKVIGEKSVWRVRVRSYRIIYEIHQDESLIVVLKVDKRGESTYKRLK